MGIFVKCFEKCLARSNYFYANASLNKEREENSSKKYLNRTNGIKFGTKF